MLNVVKSTTVTGQSKVTVDGREVVVVSMSAKISETDTSNIVSTIVNKELYETNKTTCREDIDAFTKEVRVLEDLEIQEA